MVMYVLPLFFHSFPRSVTAVAGQVCAGAGVVGQSVFLPCFIVATMREFSIGSFSNCSSISDLFFKWETNGEKTRRYNVSTVLGWGRKKSALPVMAEP